MKLLIIGDLHFGTHGNSTKYLDFQKKWIETEILPYIKTNNIRHLIFLGDVFDSRISLSPIIFTEVRKLFKKLSEVSKVYCVLGNHDIYFRNKKDVHSLEVLEDQGVILFKKPTELIIDNLKCLFIPWIVKHETEEISKILVNNSYDLCFGHLEINTFEKIKGFVEKEGLPIELFSKCKKVFSGHFHIRKTCNNVTYVGTPYELTWNDYMDTKGIYLLDTETLTEEFIESKDVPKHLIVSNKRNKIEDLTKVKIQNNIIKLIFDDKISEIEKINYIEKINSLEPFLLLVNSEQDYDFETNENIETNIKDVMGFLNEYLDVIEVPTNLNKKILLEKIETLYKQCL